MFFYSILLVSPIQIKQITNCRGTNKRNVISQPWVETLPLGETELELSAAAAAISTDNVLPCRNHLCRAVRARTELIMIPACFPARPLIAVLCAVTSPTLFLFFLFPRPCLICLLEKSLPAFPHFPGHHPEGWRFFFMVVLSHVLVFWGPAPCG